MKTTLLAAFIALSTTLLAQIPKGSTRIEISNSLSQEENYKAIISSLIHAGIFPDQKDSEMGYIKTQTMPATEYNGNYYMNIACQDDLIIITGMVKSSISINVSGIVMQSVFEPVKYSGGIYKAAFEKMDSFGDKLEGEKGYER